MLSKQQEDKSFYSKLVRLEVTDIMSTSRQQEFLFQIGAIRSVGGETGRNFRPSFYSKLVRLEEYQPLAK